ncbi:hypothetical protein O9993_12245 [Vibrio lentus]|nr:hypothetical protein [Vibrio lentus]
MWTNAWRWLKPWTSLSETQCNVSRNLKMLYKAGLLNHEKEGKWVFYTLKEQNAPHCKALVDSVRHLPEDDFKVVKRCLIRLSMRVDGECRRPRQRSVAQQN